ncbi:hypothetical protein [Actinoallomurus rhizosphaericola]|uniref:hypothetical protein n=1 Tax=Actinoallomurus rhizosphaericola TaxID=2952536 RepID=UPI00209001E7|nr:hypothetical protein [Actinoallomurus rhizosphaericola]MCO5992163.1 hypothetical protein [Actinoallomurus rhizosphaericola]
MIAAMRFQLGGYARSTRALPPVLALALLLGIVFSSPLGGTPAEARSGALTAIGDLAALYFPICAWAARGLLDTEPDAQRHIGVVALGRWRAMACGFAAAFAFTLCLALIAGAVPLVEAARSGVRTSQLLPAMALLPLSALAATALGALASRAIIHSPGRSILVLLGIYVADLLLGLGPLRVVTVPMIEWMGAAGRGRSAFTGALPWFALRTLAWAVLATALYARLRRTRA